MHTSAQIFRIAPNYHFSYLYYFLYIRKYMSISCRTMHATIAPYKLLMQLRLTYATLQLFDRNILWMRRSLRLIEWHYNRRYCSILIFVYPQFTSRVTCTMHMNHRYSFVCIFASFCCSDSNRPWRTIIMNSYSSDSNNNNEQQNIISMWPI